MQSLLLDNRFFLVKAGRIFTYFDCLSKTVLENKSFVDIYHNACEEFRKKVSDIFLRYLYWHYLYRSGTFVFFLREEQFPFFSVYIDSLRLFNKECVLYENDRRHLWNHGYKLVFRKLYDEYAEYILYFNENYVYKGIALKRPNNICSPILLFTNYGRNLIYRNYVGVKTNLENLKSTFKFLFDSLEIYINENSLVRHMYGN